MHHGDLQSPVALLLVDVINPFDFPEGEALLEQTRAMVGSLRRLKERSREQGVAIVYVNDNFGRWRSSFADTIQYCQERKGADVVDAIGPAREELFVLKPQRSGFYCTPLEPLLRDLGAKHLVICGITTDMCVLATAADAVEHRYRVWIPHDCTAASEEARRDRALRVMEEGLGATTCAGDDLPLDDLMAKQRA